MLQFTVKTCCDKGSLLEVFPFPKRRNTDKEITFPPWAATGSMDNKLIFWDLQHSSPRCTCDNEDGVTCLSWLGASKYIAAGCVDGKVRIWDSLSGDCVRIFSGHSDAIQSVAVSADRNFLLSVSLDGTARVFEIPDFQ
ncbi:Transcriptional repressor tup12 [Vitis vinifera]|uniref:Transcriptional repressor tup12 n=1 Tax=Vitis vinifera TaxID=29760 RepID=A0A438E834_VITVI|nr:Transcriptional repressor tup12 [Vitis vinifera]